MKTLSIILLGFIFSLSAKANTFSLSSSPLFFSSTDTLITNDSTQVNIISEIIETKSTPQKEKVQLISDFTRYGFRNLFTAFSYNTAIPYAAQVNPNAELYMRDYLLNHKKYLLGIKEWGLPYFNLIENIFSLYGLPRELKYLAVIESNLKTDVTSNVGAAGPWQFMPETGRIYGLVVNSRYDERRDYHKSTHAAARFLLDLYRKLNDWLLVIAAYNGGIGRVYDAQKKSGSTEFWSLQYYLPQESRNHVKKFIATHYIMENSSSENTSYSPNDRNSKTILLSEDEKKNLSLKKITGKYNAVVIAKNLNMEMTQFTRYNPEFNTQLERNGEYPLRLPMEKMQLFEKNKYAILQECIQLLLDDNSIIFSPEKKSGKEVKASQSKKGS